MRYTVVWDQDVEAAYIDRWLASDSGTRSLLSDAANWVDRNLAEEPEAKGQARPDLGARIIAVPLSSSSVRVSVTYEIWPDERQVHVIRITIHGL
jgi:hypothetical protein